MRQEKAPSRQSAGSPLAASRGDLLTHVAAARTPSPQPSPSGRGGQTVGRGFTLTELLVAIGIIALLSTLTVVSVKSLSNEARLSSGRNAVVATLAAARAYAMKNNTLVCVAFRVNWDENNPTRKQFTEMVVAEWKGERQRFSQDDPDDPCDPGSSTDPDYRLLKEVFVPVSGLAPRPLPTGIKVAAPIYDLSDPDTSTVGDSLWVTQPQFPNVKPDGASEAKGRMIAVMFAPDGSMVTRNPSGAGAASTAYVDFGNADPTTCPFQDIGATLSAVDPLTGLFLPRWFTYDEPDDEPNLQFASFLAVYDDNAARELYGDEDWGFVAGSKYIEELTEGEDRNGDGKIGYISQYADRIHFNRYTGVIMK